MNTPTLSELTRIARTAMEDALRESKEIVCGVPRGLKHDVAYYAVTAVLDAVGYKLPVDPEREAFDAWLKEQVGTDFMDMKGSMFLSWKAGREELRKAQALAKEPDTKTEPAWIEWKGGKCPIPDTVKQWEYRDRDGYECSDPTYLPSEYPRKWEHDCIPYNHIVAYRVLDWGTTKQPE